jgi:hypothetical protein
MAPPIPVAEYVHRLAKVADEATHESGDRVGAAGGRRQPDLM